MAKSSGQPEDAPSDKPATPAYEQTLQIPGGGSVGELMADIGAGSELSDTADDESIDKVIGDYVILRKIGAGGAGQVYKAQHQRMERIVALKTLLTTMDAQAIQRFHREVKSAAKLIHPNIVTAFDAGEYEGTPYLVLEFVDGESLSELVDHRGAFHVDTACDFIIQAARGLAYAHSQGIVHRDIKPSNLMLSSVGSEGSTGVIKILDMGLARSTAGAAGSPEENPADGLTTAGSIMGTVAFMSPEQCKDAKSVDHRTDIYSLGCTFYFLLTGTSVYSGEMIEILLAHAQNPIPSLREIRRDVPEQLDAVYQRMLAKRPEDRYQTMNEVIADLEEFVLREPTPAAKEPEPSLAPDSPWAKMLEDTVSATKHPSTVIESAPAVGIDLGATCSAIAYIDRAGRPVTLPNAEDELSTPSIVMVDGTSLSVGTKALEAVQTKSECIADYIKRDLGKEAYHRELGGQQYPPEVLLALVLDKLARDAREQLGDFTHVVVSVPAYFDDRRRKAVQDAAYIAGLELLDLINEPTAVAIAFAFQSRLLQKRDDKGNAPQKFLVCDIGGGTLDVTLLDFDKGAFSVLATEGTSILGGYNWDERLVRDVARLFHGKYGIDPRQDVNAANTLRRECELKRCSLSNKDEAAIKFEYNGNQAYVRIRRQKFERMNMDIIELLGSTIKRALRAAGVDRENVDRVILSGGLSRMPLIRRMVKHVTGKKPETPISVDEAVAQGAALHARGRLAKRRGQKPQFELHEVSSHSLGVIVKQSGKKVNGILIPRNTRLPASAKRTFKTHLDGQESFTVYVVQGESQSLKECIMLGKAQIDELPADLPAGSPLTVEFRCSSNGRLTVYVDQPDSGRRISQEMTRPSALAQADLDHWREWIETMMLCADL